MFELVVSDQVFSLGALAAAGSSEQEKDVRFGEKAMAAGLTLNIR